MTGLAAIGREITACALCPRLREHCGRMAREKRAAYAGETYWGRPVPGFGDPGGRLVIIGLAPGAHGANRTGRMFTGDRSGDFLYAALHRAGFASQASSRSRADGLELRDAWITAAVHCAPPGNRPAPPEFAACLPYLTREIVALPRARVFLALGGLAHRQARVALTAAELWPASAGAPPKIPRFGHGARTRLRRGWLLAAYHPSQQNTFTGRLTPAMMDRVLALARRLLATASGE